MGVVGQVSNPKFLKGVSVPNPVAVEDLIVGLEEMASEQFTGAVGFMVPVWSNDPYAEPGEPLYSTWTDEGAEWFLVKLDDFATEHFDNGLNDALLGKPVIGLTGIADHVERLYRYDGNLRVPLPKGWLIVIGFAQQGGNS